MFQSEDPLCPSLPAKLPPPPPPVEPADSVIETDAGKWELVKRSHVVRFDGRVFKLSRREWLALSAFLRSDEPLHLDDVRRAVFPFRPHVPDRQVRNVIHCLRQKLAAALNLQARGGWNPIQCIETHSTRWALRIPKPPRKLPPTA